MNENNNASNMSVKEKQAFCQHCGRNFHLENNGTNDNPIWYYPVHVVKKNFGRSTKLCAGAGNLN